MPEFHRDPIEGILTLNPLCIEEDGAIDHEKVRSNVQWLADQGMHGVIQYASMGQAHAPSEEEFDRVVDTVVDEADDMTVVIGCIAPSQQEIIRRARYAERAGADGVMVALPYAFPVKEDWIGQFFRDIDESLSELAVMVYNYPPLTGTNISADRWREELLGIDTIKALKDSNFSFIHHSDVLNTTRDHLNYISAGDVFFWHDSAFGAEGFIGILSWVAPTVLLQFYEDCKSGQQFDPFVMEVYERCVEATGAMTSLPNTPLLPYEPGILNALAELGGGFGGPPRRPYRSLSPQAFSALETAVQPLIELEREG